jgi:hypothetical protein
MFVFINPQLRGLNEIKQPWRTVFTIFLVLAMIAIFLLLILIVVGLCGLIHELLQM